VKLSKVLIIAILISILLLSCPVNATRIDYTLNSPQVAMTFDGTIVPNILYGNLTSFLTRMEGTITVIHNCPSSSYSGTVELKEATVPNPSIGTGTYTWVFNSAPGVVGTMHYVYDFPTPLTASGDWGFYSYLTPDPGCSVVGNRTSSSLPSQDLIYPAQGFSWSFGGSHTVIWNETPPTYAPICSFSASPTSGAAPLDITFADTSSNTPTSWDWVIQNNGTPIVESLHSTLQASSYILHNIGTYDLNFSASNVYGSCNIFSPNYFSTVGNFTPTEGYSLIVSPSSVAYGNNFTATILSSTGTFPDISEIRYSFSQGTGLLTDSTDPTHLLSFTNLSGTWFELDNSAGTFSVNKGSTVPSVESAIANFGIGNYVIDAYLIKTNGQVISLHTALIVTSANLQTLTIDAKDFETGALITGAHIHVLNYATNIWDNKTAVTGSTIFYYPFTTKIFVESERSSWNTSVKNWTVTNDLTYDLWMIMYRGAPPTVSNVTLNIEVIDGYDNSFIPNAQVSLSDNQAKYTSSAGVATFTILENTDYTITASKSGYQNGVIIINSGPGNVMVIYPITLHRAVAPTPTVTVPTAIPSGIPTTSPVGPAGNYTGFFGPIYSMWSAMGATALEMQLLMACFFVFCGVVVGGFGMGTIIPGAPFSATGGEAGGVFAFILACAFGFISVLWIIVVIIWVAFRYFLLK